MKKKLSLIGLLIGITLIALSGCGKKYPVFLGDSYQEVYDYCKENNTDLGEEYINECDFRYDEYGVEANLDWFGDGTLYHCEFTVYKSDNDGVASIIVRPVEDVTISDCFETFKSKYGDPIGNPNPDEYELESQGAEWEENGVVLTLEMDDLYGPKVWYRQK